MKLFCSLSNKAADTRYKRRWRSAACCKHWLENTGNTATGGCTLQTSSTKELVWNLNVCSEKLFLCLFIYIYIHIYLGYFELSGGKVFLIFFGLFFYFIFCHKRLYTTFFYIRSSRKNIETLENIRSVYTVKLNSVLNCWKARSSAGNSGHATNVGSILLVPLLLTWI